MMPSTTELNEGLAEARNGNRAALNELMPVVYQELRRLAKRHMSRQRRGHTLQTTELVNEAYLRLAKAGNAASTDRIHFLALASGAMRSVLVDHFRRRRRAKRGANPVRVSIDETMVVSEQRAAEIIAIDEALKRLAALDPQKSRIVELRYFGGLSVEETAEVVGAAPITVKREWARARAWLHRELAPETTG
jgi:RNA polymerase sigma factor (TIGR02999 family)